MTQLVICHVHNHVLLLPITRLIYSVFPPIGCGKAFCTHACVSVTEEDTRHIYIRGGPTSTRGRREVLVLCDCHVVNEILWVASIFDYLVC